MTVPIAIMAAAAGGGQRPPELLPLLFWFAADGSEGCRMYSDVAGTTPAIAGGSVARIRGDEGSAFEQTTAARRPVRSANGKGLVFNASNDTSLASISGSALPPAIAARSTFTMVLAAQYSAVGTALAFDDGGDMTSLGWDNLGGVQGLFTFNGDTCYSGVITGTNRNVLVARLSGWNSGTGMQIDTPAGTVVANSHDPASYIHGRIGAEGSGSGSNHCSMTLHELIIYAGELSDSQVAQVIDYAQDRWGI